MSYGLLQQGGNVKNQAMSGIRDAAKLEQNRNLSNSAIDRQGSQAKTSNATAGATTGAMMGVRAANAAIASGSAAAGTGTLLASGLASGGIGLAAGLLLSELF